MITLTTLGRGLATVPIVWALMAPQATAQTTSPFLFSIATPNSSGAGGGSQTGTAIAERGLTIWNGAAFDPGVSAEVSVTPYLMVRSMRGTVDFVSDGQRFTSFQQVEVLRSIGHNPRRELAIGGGVRQEWGGTRTLVGRVVGGLRIAGGRLESNAVFEKALASGRDQVDVITTVGWSHRVCNLVSLGVEGIGQDLEGFWERDEAEGGAQLLFGPSVHIATPERRWSFTVAGGPLVRSLSTVPPSDARREMSAVSGRGPYAVLGSLTYEWSPR